MGGVCERMARVDEEVTRRGGIHNGDAPGSEGGAIAFKREGGMEGAETHITHCSGRNAYVILSLKSDSRGRGT